MNNNSKLISHNEYIEDFDNIYNEIKNKITNRGNLPHVSVDRQLNILSQLSEFPFGKFMLANKGWDGYWTNYAVMHPYTGRLTGLNSEGKKFSDMESFLLDHSPTVLATQQRFKHFKENIQWLISDNSTIASIPCGMMGDLLTLDYSIYENVKLVGIDLDETSLKLAAEYAEHLNTPVEVDFVLNNAWDLENESEFDVITSNGLNIYEPDDNKVISLYKNFYKALKPDSFILTSTVTPPPQIYDKSCWIMENINKEDLLLEQIIFIDIMGVSWTQFRTVEKNTRLLEEAGFKSVEVIYDKAHIFPTFLAKKQ